VALGTLLVLPLLGLGAGPAAGAADAPTPVVTVDETGDVTYYVVRDSWQGEPEFLYSIAERLLGTGERAMEIYGLNEGREQPGGATVSDPNVIRPGWVLVLPPDATGDGVEVGPLPTPAPRAVRATPSPSGTTSSGTTSSAASPAPSSTARGTAPGRDADASADDARAGTTSSYVTTGVTVLVAATAGVAVLVVLVGGLVVLMRRRRERRTPPPAAPVRREDPGAWTIDRTTRALARACADAGRPVPAVHALVVSDDDVRLRLRTPDAAPPPGWSATADGLTWTSRMRALQDVALDERVVAPYPRLVTLGDDAHGRVLVDLAQAGPGFALDGDPGRAVRLVEQWSAELATSPWSRHLPVVTVGAGPSSYGGLDDAGPAIDSAGAGVLLVVGARARDAQRLAALAADPAWSVVVVGPAGRGWARWRLTLDADGVATGGPLDADVHVQVGEQRLELV